MNKHRAIVVEGDAASRRRLREWIEADAEVLVTAEAATAREAAVALQEEEFDILCVAARLPDGTGFKVVESLSAAERPVLILINAEEAHAVRAFALEAVDCLVRPLDAARVAVALQRAKAELARRRTEALRTQVDTLLRQVQERTATPSAPAAELGAASVAEPAESGLLERIVLRESGEIHFLKVADIDWIEAEGDYMKLHAGGRVHTLRETMNRLEARLEAKRFVRIHRSTIVNLDRVKKLSPSFDGEYAVFLHDGTKLRLSRGYHERIEGLLRGEV